MAGFERISGFPNVAGAVDGTLIKRVRPKTFWGWYCRKGFVAYNVQCVVDSDMLFMDLSVRPRGWNDKRVLCLAAGRTAQMLGRP